MNGAVLPLLGAALDLHEKPQKWPNGLEKLTGGWSEEEFQEFERNRPIFGVIDEEMWK